MATASGVALLDLVLPAAADLVFILDRDGLGSIGDIVEVSTISTLPVEDHLTLVVEVPGETTHAA